MQNVSVIIPTYNRSNYITKAIDSVLCQKFQDFEIIVIDDGSTDDTQLILSPYIKKKHIQYIYQDNKGVSGARNTGIQKAKGEWIAFLDSDDIWLPSKLYRQMQIVKLANVQLGCIICNMKYDPPIGTISNSFENAHFIPKHLQGICINISSILLTRFILFNQGAMIRKIYLDEVGGYDEQLEILEDYDLALKLSFLCQWAYDTTPLVIYKRGSQNSLSLNVTRKHETEKILQILQNLENYLSTKNISKPNLLKNQIKHHSIQQKYAHFPFAMLVFKMIGFLRRNLPKYPKPETEEINLRQSTPAS